jgi:hypothetical protein
MVVKIVFFKVLCYNKLMSEVSPIRERQLLIDTELQAEFRDKIDPLIDRAFKARGYTEERIPSDHIYLDSNAVLPSKEYLKQFSNIPFDVMKVATSHEVFDDERQLTRGQLDLSRIGGISKSKFIQKGTLYSTVTTDPTGKPLENGIAKISETEAQEILQDIRAYTELGYSSSDTFTPVSETIEELEALNSARRVDKRAHYQILTDGDHGDIQMNVGESYESRNVNRHGKIVQRRSKTRKLFELIARQPVDGGSIIIGAHYSSGRNNLGMKLTTEIIGDGYSDKDKQAYYNDTLITYQEEKIRKLGKGIIANLSKIIDENSDVVRLG